MKLNFALCGFAKSALTAAAILFSGLCYSASPAAAQAAPAAPELSKYIIGPGDSLQISVWHNPELSTSVPVRPDGRISTPLVTDVVAAGRTPEELGHDIEARLKKYVSDPLVTVIVPALWAPTASRCVLSAKRPSPRRFPIWRT